MATATARRGTFRALRHRNAQLFFSGLLVSSVGTWIQFTAMALLVNDLAGSGKGIALGITVACQFLPVLVLGAWAGALNDRWNRRTVTLWTQSALAVQALLLGVFDLAGWINL